MVTSKQAAAGREPARALQGEPDADTYRRQLVAVEFPVGRRARIRLEEQAPAPARPGCGARVLKLEPGHEAPAHLPSILLARLAVEPRDQTTATEPPEVHQCGCAAVFEPAVEHARAQAGGDMVEEILSAPVDPPMGEVVRHEQLGGLESQLKGLRQAVHDVPVAQVGALV